MERLGYFHSPPSPDRRFIGIEDMFNPFSFVGRQIGKGVNYLGQANDDEDAPPFMPQAGRNPINAIFGRRPRLPQAGELPAGELSEMPNIPLPGVNPIDTGQGDRWHAPMVLPQPPSEQVPLSDTRPMSSATLQRPDRIPMPDVPQLPGHSGGPMVPTAENQSRYDYVMSRAKKNPDGTYAGEGGKFKFKRSGGDILMNALAELGQGIASGQGLGGGLGNAAASALGTIINPQAGAERRFDREQLPRIQQQQQQQERDEDRQRAIAMQQVQQQRQQSQGIEDQARAELLRAQASQVGIPKPRTVDLAPMVLPDGTTVLVDKNDPGNAGREYRPFVRPEKPPSALEAQRNAEQEREASEGSVEQIAGDSYSARGGDAYVRSQLPANLREILDNGTTKGRKATTEELADAQDYEEKAIARQKRADLDYTKAEARKTASKMAVGKRPGAASAGGTRSLQELTNKYFGGK